MPPQPSASRSRGLCVSCWETVDRVDEMVVERVVGPGAHAIPADLLRRQRQRGRLADGGGGRLRVLGIPSRERMDAHQPGDDAHRAVTRGQLRRRPVALREIERPQRDVDRARLVRRGVVDLAHREDRIGDQPLRRVRALARSAPAREALHELTSGFARDGSDHARAAFGDRPVERGDGGGAPRDRVIDVAEPVVRVREAVRPARAAPAGAFVAGQLERAFERGDALARGADAHRLLAGLAVPGSGAIRHLGAVPVMGERGGAHARGTVVLELLGRAAMQRAPLRVQQPLVDDVADQRVLEAERTVGHQQLVALEVPDGLLDRRPGQPAQRGRREGWAEDARDLQHRLRFVRHPVDAAGDHRLDGVGRLERRDPVVEATVVTATGGGVEQTLVAQRERELAAEERVAA